MKLSISLPDEDVEFLDSYSAEHGIATRSATLQRAVRMLKASNLGRDYAESWEEWETSGDGELWEGIVSDGIET